MNLDPYEIRWADAPGDDQKLVDLYASVFGEVPVDELAKTLYHHLPGMDKKYWMAAFEKSTGRLVSALALIPWTWKMNGIDLKVAEMGLVGTLEPHRGKGLMGRLIQTFDRVVEKEGFDLAKIQGIPGFYHRFGFHYAVPIEIHVNLGFHQIGPENESSLFCFRPATRDDIPYFMDQDKAFAQAYDICVSRTPEMWAYLLSFSKKTEYGSEFIIMEDEAGKTAGYFRITTGGFGPGLMIAEMGQTMEHQAVIAALAYCREKAQSKNKPYLRLNMHPDSAAVKWARERGAETSSPYAWQVKLADPARFLTKIRPILEKRLKNSSFFNLSGKLRLNFYVKSLDLIWEKGRLAAITPGDEADCPRTFCINPDLAPCLFLGHRTWREIQFLRPDIFPVGQYRRPSSLADDTGLLVDALFPGMKSWVVEQY